MNPFNLLRDMRSRPDRTSGRTKLNFCTPLVVALLLIANLFYNCIPVRAQTSGETIGVYYVGPEDRIAVSIDRAAPYLIRVDQPDLAQVIIINNAPLRETLQAFRGEIQQEQLGLVLFCGPFFPQDVDDLRLLLGFSTFGLDQTENTTSVAQAATDDPLAKAIAWRSAPELRARTVIANPNLLQPIVTTSDQNGVIQRVRGREQSQALIVGAWTSHPSNDLWQDWAYFDYLVYRLAADAAGANRILSYVDYQKSPTPERNVRWAIAGSGTGLLLLAGAIYYGARRRLYLNPQRARGWEQLTPPPSTVSPAAGTLSNDSTTSQSESRPASLPDLGAQTVRNQAGFHQPLAGFLAYLPLALLLVVPLLLYERLFIPDILISDTQGYQAWLTVSRWTLAFWTLLDAGMGTAAVRHFATARRRWPKQAVKYLQFYVWWQFLSGTLQIGLVAVLTAVALPAVGLAHFTYYLLARAALQFPGFLQMFTITFRAQQRFDYEKLLIFFAQIITPLLQIGFVLALTPWGQVSVEFPLGITGAFGLVAGTLVGQSLTFGIGAMLYRRAGQPLRPLFVPTHDSRVAREMLQFGAPWSLGAAAPAIGAVVQIILLEPLLRPLGTDAIAWLQLTQTMNGFEILLIGLYRSLMPTLCEAATFGYKSLLRYYVSQGMRYGAWFSFFLFGTVSALGPLVLNLAPELSATLPSEPVSWLILLAAWGALRWATWLPDRMLEAAGRTDWVALLAIFEQVMRIGGAYVLLRVWGLYGLPAAYAIALLVRAILSKWLASRHLVEARIYIWQTLIVPAIAGLGTYELLQVVGLILAPATWQGAATIAVGLVLPTLLLYGFLTAMLGGWDNGGLTELRRAVHLSGIGRPFAWLLYQAIAVGARFSPLHGRFPIHLYDLAQSDAQSLTFAQIQEP